MKKLILFVMMLIIAFPLLALAANGGPEDEVKLGAYALPVILMVVLGAIYKMVETIPDRCKPIVAIGVGIALGLVGMHYAAKPWTFPNIVDYVLYGLMAGAASVGLYEMNRAVRKPRA